MSRIRLLKRPCVESGWIFFFSRRVLKRHKGITKGVRVHQVVGIITSGRLAFEPIRLLFSCVLYMKVIPRLSPPSNMAEQSQVRSGQWKSSNLGKILHIHCGIWSCTVNTTKYSLGETFQADGTDWRDVQIQKQDNMCSSKTSMHLAPFRVAGMDQSGNNGEGNVQNSSKGRMVFQEKR